MTLVDNMDSVEISKILRQICGDMFVGVYARDQLPRITRRPSLLIANTDAADRPGTHWIAIYFDADETGELFDPLAQPIHGDFSDYVNKYCKRWITNIRQIQSVVSRFCGHHCVVYCCLRAKGVDINALSKLYTNDYGYNDVISHEIVCRRLKK